ncbi:MAG TPA: universal stress protein [Candidatus Dormibacteraeota bacterium]|nr:universal stress protein [Candidatus Dormibacteraeota bacterium]
MIETARLLVCIDGSHASLEAARLAIQLAQRWHSQLRAVYVVETAGSDGAPDADRISRLRDSGHAILSRIVELASQSGVTADQGMLEGTPFEVILEDARKWKADVIIMGRTGRTGPGRALLGSEAERVLEFSDRPVLIVPMTETAA